MNGRGSESVRGGYRVTVTPTICDGQVVRWFTSDYAMDRCEPAVSASRNEVVVHDLHIRTSADYENASELLAWAWAWQGRIRNGESFTHLATHERKGLTGPMVERVHSGGDEAAVVNTGKDQTS